MVKDEVGGVGDQGGAGAAAVLVSDLERAFADVVSGWAASPVVVKDEVARFELYPPSSRPGVRALWEPAAPVQGPLSNLPANGVSTTEPSEDLTSLEDIAAPEDASGTDPLEEVTSADDAIAPRGIASPTVASSNGPAPSPGPDLPGAAEAPVSSSSQETASPLG